MRAASRISATKAGLWIGLLEIPGREIEDMGTNVKKRGGGGLLSDGDVGAGRRLRVDKLLPYADGVVLG